MERIVKKPSAIFCADLHLRETVPIARTDDYVSAQWRKMDFISNLQKRYSCPVYCGGDVFDHWKPSPYLLAETIKHLPKSFITCLGNHDLPQHSLDLMNKCGVNVLREAGMLVVTGTHFGQIPEERTAVFNNNKLLVWHTMVWQKTKPYPTCVDPPASAILKKYPMYSTILCGDNHKTFVEQYEGRILVNPGSLMRMDADQIDHKPSVFLWYSSDNTVEQVFLPIEEGVVSREHLIVKEERDNRIDAFIAKLSNDYETKLSFEDNLENFFKANEISEDVRGIIYKAIEI